jgi:hypothetical protein
LREREKGSDRNFRQKGYLTQEKKKTLLYNCNQFLLSLEDLTWVWFVFCLCSFLINRRIFCSRKSTCLHRTNFGFSSILFAFPWRSSAWFWLSLDCISSDEYLTEITLEFDRPTLLQNYTDPKNKDQRYFLGLEIGKTLSYSRDSSFWLTKERMIINRGKGWVLSWTKEERVKWVHVCELLLPSEVSVSFHLNLLTNHSLFLFVFDFFISYHRRDIERRKTLSNALFILSGERKVLSWITIEVSELEYQNFNVERTRDEKRMSHW